MLTYASHSQRTHKLEKNPTITIKMGATLPESMCLREMDEQGFKSMPLPILQALRDLSKLGSFWMKVQFLETLPIQDPQWKKIESNLYSYQGYRLQLGFPSMLDGLVEKLRLTQEARIQSAPEVVAYSRSSDYDGMLVTHYPGAKDDNLLTFAQAKETRSGISPNAKAAFLEDIAKLNGKGWSHDFAHRGTDHWRYDQSSDKFRLDCWDALRPLKSDREGAKIFNAVETLLRS
ncbi:MAG: hypothetical protein K2X66_13045 [Cyanobacteria bacterium]|nr:hypothetical protein [Cyanobacteriota bacterium]